MKNHEKLKAAIELIKDMELSYLQELQTAIRSEMTRAEAEIKRKALADIRQIAAAAGISLHEIMKAKEERTAKKTGPVLAKYQHPEQPKLQWSGRGRRPQWVSDWYAEHGSMDGITL